MPIQIDNPDTDRLARRIAELTGESITEAVSRAVKERYERVVGNNDESLRNKVRPIQERVAKLPRLDNRSDDEILGYDEFGLPS